MKSSKNISSMVWRRVRGIWAVALLLIMVGGGSVWALSWSQTGNFTVEGNVGIGTLSPATIFHVDGPASNGWAVFERADKQLFVNANWYAEDNFAQIAPRGSDNMGLSLSSDDGKPERLFISATGDIGVGTATPTAKLDIAGDMRISGDIKTNGDICIGRCDD